MNIALHGKKVLVTGASGFLGSALCSRLTRLGAEAHGVSRNAYQIAENGLRWWQADLSHDGEARRLLDNIRPDYIYHLAGLPDGRRDLDLLVPTFINNAETTVRLLAAAAECGCRRFIYSSSMEEPAYAEQSPKPHSPYSASKWVGSVYCRMSYELYGLPVVSLRVFLTYGPGPQTATKLIPYVITSLLRGESPQLSSGSRLVDAVFIDDVADAFLAALDGERALGQVVEVGSGQPVSIAEIARMIARLVGGSTQPAFGALPDRPDEVMPSADIERSRELLGWRPQVSLETGLRRTIDWYRNEIALSVGSSANESEGRDTEK